MTSSLTAVVVTHNSAAVIDGCLTPVCTALPDTEIIVVGNASRDVTVAAVRKYIFKRAMETELSRDVV